MTFRHAYFTRVPTCPTGMTTRKQVPIAQNLTVKISALNRWARSPPVSDRVRFRQRFFLASSRRFTEAYGARIDDPRTA
jgi:hypothetical protein